MAQTSPDFTIADVLAFCRTKPADEQYPFLNAYHCAAGQFGRATGRKSLVGCGDLRKLGHLELHKAVIASPWTFGALATRLEALLPAEPKTNWTELETYLTADCGEYVS